MEGTIITISPASKDVTGYKVKFMKTEGTSPKIIFAKDLGNHLLIFSNNKLKGTALVLHMGVKKEERTMIIVPKY